MNEGDPFHNRHSICFSRGMDKGLEKIAVETTIGMSKLAMLKTANELEEIARIIRRRVCSSCAQCQLLPCSQVMVWMN